jgi:hypothetical protein
MHPFALLLRLLLCACLIANGIGAAQASVRMAFAHADVPGDAPARSRADAPCHDLAMPDTPRGPHAAATGAAMSMPSDHAGHGQNAPCEGKSGTCACVPPGTCDAAPVAFLPALAAATPAPAPLSVAYHQPRMAHLIRPPIG